MTNRILESITIIYRSTYTKNIIAFLSISFYADSILNLPSSISRVLFYHTVGHVYLVLRYGHVLVNTFAEVEAAAVGA